jgi:hypothetical protein
VAAPKLGATAGSWAFWQQMDLDDMDFAVSETATVEEIRAMISGDIRNGLIEIGSTASPARMAAFEQCLDNLAGQIATVLATGVEDTHAEALENLAEARRKWHQRLAAWQAVVSVSLAIVPDRELRELATQLEAAAASQAADSAVALETFSPAVELEAAFARLYEEDSEPEPTEWESLLMPLPPAEEASFKEISPKDEAEEASFKEISPKDEAASSEISPNDDEAEEASFNLTAEISPKHEEAEEASFDDDFAEDEAEEASLKAISTKEESSEVSPPASGRPCLIEMKMYTPCCPFHITRPNLHWNTPKARRLNLDWQWQAYDSDSVEEMQSEEVQDEEVLDEEVQDEEVPGEEVSWHGAQADDSVKEEVQNEEPLVKFPAAPWHENEEAQPSLDDEFFEEEAIAQRNKQLARWHERLEERKRLREAASLSTSSTAEPEPGPRRRLRSPERPPSKLE